MRVSGEGGGVSSVRSESKREREKMSERAVCKRSMRLIKVWVGA